jgi:DNA-binding MarR family transcriptional regulator
MKGEHEHAGTPPATALLRRPEMLVKREVLTALRKAGFVDVLPAHLGVFQYPGPDGQRPGMLAQRNQASKQSMNHLLHQLEEGGYLYREPQPGDRRSRVVRLTERGWAAAEVIGKAMDTVENSWAAALGEGGYTALRGALARLDELIERGEAT